MATITTQERSNKSELTSVFVNTRVTETISSYGALVIFQWIVFPILCQGIDIFGIAANIINIFCFVKQGFKDPVNVSLVGLAVSDIGCLLTLIWPNICLTPAFTNADLPFEPIEFQHLTSGMLHATFTRITGWITALVTLERCLCIAAPLKVKSILTANRVSVITAVIFLVLLVSGSPVYVVNKLGMKFYPVRNKTLIGLVFTGDRQMVETISYAINNVSIPFTAFVLIILCTIILVIKLKNQTNWRKISNNTTQCDNVSSRNLKVSKMVVMISAMFIAYFVPVSIIFIAMTLVPGLSVEGEFRQILMIVAGLGIVLESINSSVNIFVYYHMSTNYRLVFHQLFYSKIVHHNIFTNS